MASYLDLNKDIAGSLKPYMEYNETTVTSEIRTKRRDRLVGAVTFETRGQKSYSLVILNNKVNEGLILFYLQHNVYPIEITSDQNMVALVFENDEFQLTNQSSEDEGIIGFIVTMSTDLGKQITPKVKAWLIDLYETFYGKNSKIVTKVISNLKAVK